MKLFLNNKFYSRESIDNAIDAFKDICICTIEDESFCIDINTVDGTDESKAADEFSNFCLGFAKERMF